MKNISLTFSKITWRKGCILAIAALLGLLPTLTRAQASWQTAPAAPFGRKQGLIGVGPSTLFTRVSGGVLRTTDLGLTWTRVLRARRTYSLFLRDNGGLLVGGRGKIYRSFDAGTTWDSVAVATNYDIVSLTQTPDGLLAGTGDTDRSGFVGDGVFFSNDNGQTWMARNLGLEGTRHITHLLTSRNGRRVYAGVKDEDASHPQGLYTSTNSGRTWQHSPVRITGNGVVGNNVVVDEITTLTTTPQDSVLLGVNGTAGTAMVYLVLRKHVTDVADTDFAWSTPRQGSIWWNQVVPYRISVTSSGVWYGSVFGDAATGGTMYSRNQGRSWTLLTTGLGLSSSGIRELQSFAEMPDGKLYMIQDGDPQLYFTNPAIVNSTQGHKREAVAVQLFPNPATSHVQLTNASGHAIRTVELLDLHGRRVRSFAGQAAQHSQTLALDATPAGLYLLRVTLANGQTVQQRLLKYD